MSFVYQGLKIQRDRHIITEEEIDRNIERLQQQNPRVAVITDRPTKLGDEVLLDYAGFCEGEQFAGGTAEKQTLVLGSGMFIPGFEEQLVDKVPGETVVVNVNFPEQYHADNLAGKPAAFRCVIHEIREKTAYELDDVFAREVGGCETFAEMRVKLGESLQAYSDERGEMDLQDRLLRQAAETLEFTPENEQLDKELDAQMETMRAQLARQGLSLEMYCQFLNVTEEKLREDARPNAEQSLRLQAAVEKIADLEKLEATEQDIADACAQICRQNQMTMEQLKPHYNAEFEAAVIRSILTGKVMRLIRDAAEITEAE